jgi:hypothetical protein
MIVIQRLCSPICIFPKNIKSLQSKIWYLGRRSGPIIFKVLFSDLNFLLKGGDGQFAFLIFSGIGPFGKHAAICSSLFGKEIN